MEQHSLENGGRAGKPVPCPRCQSSNTKFCYFNNHNVNQPRHFCRDCQRYWTAGGSLRNVPIGAGKRKHKGPLVIPTKSDNLPTIFSFHPDQGVYPSSVDPTNVFSFKQHVPHSYAESKLVETPAAAPQEPAVVDSKPQVMPTFASRPHVPASYDAANVVPPQTRAFVCSPGPDKVGFTDLRKQPSLSLGLNLSKDASVQEGVVKMASHMNYNPPDFTSSQNAGKQDVGPPQYNTERDESTGCSSVTANLGPSGSEAAAESTNPTMKVPTMPSMEPATGVLNPMAALGASMCPPWLWPFILNGRNVVPPAGVAHVDPTFAAAAMGAMASMSPINPAFAAAMGAMASGGRLPQIDPSIMAALTASFLQFPQLWNPYTWGLPWNTAWNMTNAVGNAPNAANKRPASPSREEGGASKLAKKESTHQEACLSTGAQPAEVVNDPNFSSPTGYFDAFRPKTDVSPLKPDATAQLDEHLDTHQQASPHLNPAAQARSAAFQEGG
ncbi:hypothetical protein L7F22_055743 [Adiantum nelumboides]|nr:hypothetical protein [Adiantum nelumboides]